MVYRTGGDYFPEYVRRLAKGLRKHGAKNILCLSNDPGVRRYCDYMPLKEGWPGWWSKLELFRLSSGKHVYFDLDTVIAGDIRPMLSADYSGGFWMLRGFHTGMGASGVMAWDGDYSGLMQGFTKDRIGEYKTRARWGDQGWITDHLGQAPDFLQDRFPGMIVSRKKNTKAERSKAAVICYHGRPRPHITGWAA